MPRIARAVAIGYPHHVTQRGNYQQPIFDEEEDYLRYRAWLRKYSRKYGLDIWAYCLMTNHVHLVCVPNGEDSLAKAFNTLHMRYSQSFNRKKGLKGHLWQGRFFSCVLDERHLYAAIRYVENNPVRARLTEDPGNYSWSSARGHIYKDDDPVLSRNCHLETEIKDWRRYLEETDEEGVIETIRKNSMTGRPCGDDQFINALEKLLGRELRAKPRGRPRKAVKK